MATNEADALGLVVVVRLIDGAGNDPRRFDHAIESLIDLADPASECSPVLVHCRAGRSRSVAVVAGYLAAARHLSVAQAVSFISERRYIALAPELRALLERKR